MAVKRDMYNVEAPDHAHGVDDEHDHDEDDGHVHRKLRHDVHRDHTHEEDDHDHDHEHDDEHLHEDELTEDAHSTYDMLSAESLFDAYKGEDDLLGIEVSGVLHDKHTCTRHISAGLGARIYDTCVCLIGPDLGLVRRAAAALLPRRSSRPRRQSSRAACSTRTAS